MSIFSDSFIRLGSIATFWNLCTPGERLHVMKSFFAKLFRTKGACD
jgi:hypothetical protein